MFTKGDDFPKYETKKGGRKEKNRIFESKSKQTKEAAEKIKCPFLKIKSLTKKKKIIK
jgi:hypothetical protein